MKSGDMSDDSSLAQEIDQRFGVALEVDRVIARTIDVGQSAKATLFLSKKKQLYCYIDGPARLVLGDVKKIAARIGLKPETFFPPKAQPHYFDDIGREKFRQVFPDRKAIREGDLTFYRTLAPYTPAFILVQEIKEGTIYQADTDARGGWRPVVKFSYRRIKTS